MRIALTDPYLKYSPEDAHRSPLGGTETSFICLAEALQCRGHDVHVYLSEPRARCFKGVSYHGPRGFPARDCDVVVARWPHLFEGSGKRSEKCIWWCHKSVDAESVLEAQKRRVYPVVTSRFQAEQLLDHDWRGGFDVVPLGCRMLKFAPAERRREPLTAVWTSALDRGLEQLLRIWRDIRRRLPPASRLLIVSGEEVYREYGSYLKPLEKRLRAETRGEPDIEWPGAQAPEELFSLLSICGYMPYSATVPESFCLSVLEAQAAGCLPIVTPRGALKERVVHGRTGWIEPLERFAERIVSYSEEATGPATEPMRLAAREAASRLTWAEAARRFEAAIANCMATCL